MATPRLTSYSVTVGSGVYAGFINPSAPTVGVWQQLTVAPHLRKLITSSGGSGSSSFDASNAIAHDALAPATVSAVPNKPYAPFVRGERGVLYYVGGLHSNYPGNEQDRIELPKTGTQLAVSINHQPSIPPVGPGSGYASGQGYYVHRQYGSAMADATLWQPHPGHTWTSASWHPEWGHIVWASYALNNGATVDGNGHPIPSGVSNNSSNQPLKGVVGYSYATGKYTKHLDNSGAFPTGYLGTSGFSDYSPVGQEMWFLQTQAESVHLQRHRLSGGLSYRGFSAVLGGFDGASGNGLLMRHLEASKWLILRQDNRSGSTFLQRTKIVLFSPDFAPWPADPLTTPITASHLITLTFPTAYTSDLPAGIDCITFCVDRNSRRVFWLVFPGVTQPLRFYVSTFEDLMGWTPITVTPNITIANIQYYDSFLADNRGRMFFEDGFLYLCLPRGGPSNPGYTDGAIDFRRCKVDSGEALPLMTFTRYDYRIQNFQFSSDPILQLTDTKHVNWARRSVDGAYYQCGGDFGSAFNQSMAKLTFSGNGPSNYTFTELLNETSPAPAGKVRPVSTDDGAFFYLGASNANSALSDKFLYQRGGEGVGFASNNYTRAVYASSVPAGALRDQWNAGSDVAQGVAAMQADGWTLEKYVLFDPTNNTFTPLETASWPLTHGFPVAPTHPSLMSNAASRCGTFDSATNCVFRFYSYSGNLVLVRYDLNNQTVRMWQVSSWFDTGNLMGAGAGTRWFCDNTIPPSNATIINGFGFFDSGASRYRCGAPNHWEHKALWIDSRDGKLYCVAPNTGYLWCYETRGAESNFAGTGTDGLTIPFYPVGQRIPTVGTYPVTGSRDAYPPVAFGAVSNGTPGYTNGDVSMNSFLVPFKGGLLWWSSAHHDGGVSGNPLYCFWRRLGYTGPWTVVSTPQEFAANAFAPSTYAHDNSEIMLISNTNAPGQTPWFWRLT